MIVDLRDYTMAPGGRARMIERFEALFMDEQERLGATILGMFLDADDDNRVVWFRAVPDLETRKRVLTTFYGEGAMWREHRDTVNAWFTDTDNVLLLRPISELAPPATVDSIVGMYTHVQQSPLSPETAAQLQQTVARAITDAGGRPLVTFATDPAENNYPKHAIRTGEHGLVWLATFQRYQPLALISVEQRRLIPAPRSRLR